MNERYRPLYVPLFSRNKWAEDAPLARFYKYFLVLSLLAITGFEYFFRIGALTTITLLVLTWVFLEKRKRNLERRFLWIAIPFFVQKLLYSVVFHNTIVFGFVVFFFLYYFLAKTIEKDFWRYYINILVFFAAISLIFYTLQATNQHIWILENVTPYFEPLGLDQYSDEFEKMEGHLEHVRPNIVIHKFLPDEPDARVRNAGPFWEPGLFVGFLVIALFMNIVAYGRSLFSFKNLLLIAATVTTYSTTGYLMLMTVVFYCVWVRINHPLAKLLMVSFFLSGAVLLMTQMDFMGEKISSQARAVEGADAHDTTRFGAIFVHMQMIVSSPLFGFNHEQVEAMTDVNALPNGITVVFVSHGVPIGIYYYILLYYACRNIMAFHSGSRFAFRTFLFLLLLFAFSQDITTRHFYYFLIILGLFAYPNPKKHYVDFSLRPMQFTGPLK